VNRLATARSETNKEPGSVHEAMVDATPFLMRGLKQDWLSSSGYFSGLETIMSPLDSPAKVIKPGIGPVAIVCAFG